MRVHFGKSTEIHWGKGEGNLRGNSQKKKLFEKGNERVGLSGRNERKGSLKKIAGNQNGRSVGKKMS